MVPKAWFKPFTKSLKKYGFSKNQGGGTLYFKCTPFMKMNIPIVYVDNIIVAVYNFKEIPSLKMHLTVCKESMYLIS